MNNKNILIIALISILFSSCTVKSYYQVYKATPTNNLVTQDKLLVYEDENCKVSYDLWVDGGDIGFEFYNKTDQNIYY